MQKFLFTVIIFCFVVSSWGQFDPFEGDKKPVTAKAKIEQTSKFLIIQITFDIAKNVHVYSSKERFFNVVEQEKRGLGKTTITLPKTYKYKEVDNTYADVFDGKAVVTLKKTYVGKVGDPWETKGYLQYQACDKGVCYPPTKINIHFKGIIPKDAELAVVTEDATSKKKTSQNIIKKKSGDWKKLAEKFTVINEGVGYMNSNDFIAFLGKTKKDEGLFGKSLLAIIFIILIGGLGLNLTPCVLPLIPINLAIIGAGAKASSKTKGFILGTVYGLGMALAYGGLGVAVILTGSKFGTINSYPSFNFAIAGIFVVLALAMFDIIIIDFSKWKSKKGVKEEQRGKFFTAFFMGIIAALLAGACVAPVLISVLLYSNSLYAAGNKVALLLPFLLGVGMALPWPFAGASLSLLPKPGAWMVKVKYFFGVFIILMAAYYGYLGYELLSENKVSTSEISHEGWTSDIEKGLSTALKEKKPVIIDFWATWCKNCITMDKTTFKDKKVIKALEKYTKIKYQAEKLDQMPEKEVLDYYKVQGLPTYIILKPKN